MLLTDNFVILFFAFPLITIHNGNGLFFFFSFISQLFREVRIMKILDHPNIGTVFFFFSSPLHELANTLVTLFV